MLKYFIEIQQFGLNWLTAIFLITIFFTLLQGYSLCVQNKAITKNESGETVSFVFYSFYGFSALAIIFYGINKQSLAITINGFVGFIVIFIITNLLRYKSIPLKEKIVGLLSSLVIPLTIIVDNKDMLLLLFGFVVQLALLMQIFELKTKKKVGSFRPHQAITSIFSGTFWLIYSLVMNIWPLVIVNITGIILWVITIVFYSRCKK